ncbi:hypothetical protein HGP28_02015 [Vibrio sp. SM6]|uniref:Uncharacterized protein n=1 Tax=Vibrio agarilyticus TaxID=2726741 RepID=A0A7X8YFH5_9VIBR|nr:hypothetical protein [Vibrio agarilyticus]NLS11664.1 hypothetical protein [Vibrio agarilyticus]
MYKLVTQNVTEWKDAMLSKHQLPLSLTAFNRDSFYSSVKSKPIDVIDGVTLAHVFTSPYTGTYSNRELKGYNDAFLLTHTYGKFIGHQENRAFDLCNETFIIDLSKNFEGRFIGEGQTKALIIPFDVLNPHAVDIYKTTSLNQNPFYLTLEMILKNISIEDESSQINYKVSAIANLLSIYNSFEEEDILEKIKIKIELYVNKGESFNLDRLSYDFCMSRRKMQYLLKENGLTFRTLSASVKERLLSK